MRHTALSVITSLLIVATPAFAQTGYVPPKLVIVRVAPRSDAEQQHRRVTMVTSMAHAAMCVTSYGTAASSYCMMHALADPTLADTRISDAKTTCAELTFDTPAAQRDATYAWCVRDRLEPTYAVTLVTDISEKK